MIWETAKVSDMTDADYAMWLAAMEPEKHARVERLRQADDRRRSVCADHLARVLAARICGCDPAEIVLGATDRGKPIVVGLPVEIGISHSGDRVLCAAGDRPIGVDIQQIRPVRSAMIRRVCSAAEAAYVGADGARFYEIWTFKEAVFKYRGTGFTRFADVDFFGEAVAREFHRNDDYQICIVTE